MTARWPYGWAPPPLPYEPLDYQSYANDDLTWYFAQVVIAPPTDVVGGHQFDQQQFNALFDWTPWYAAELDPVTTLQVPALVPPASVDAIITVPAPATATASSDAPSIVTDQSTPVELLIASQPFGNIDPNMPSYYVNWDDDPEEARGQRNMHVYHHESNNDANKIYQVQVTQVVVEVSGATTVRDWRYSQVVVEVSGPRPVYEIWEQPTEPFNINSLGFEWDPFYYAAQNDTVLDISWWQYTAIQVPSEASATADALIPTIQTAAGPTDAEMQAALQVTDDQVTSGAFDWFPFQYVADATADSHIAPLYPRRSLSNTADAGTEGTLPTTGNTGGGNGDAFDTVQTSQSGLRFTDFDTARNGKAYRWIAGSGTRELTWNTGSFVQRQSQLFGRFYVWMGTYPTSTVALMSSTRPGGESPSTNTSIQVNGGGQMLVATAGGNPIFTFTTPLPLERWARVEWRWISGRTDGYFEVRLFLDPNSSTPDETKTFSGDTYSSIGEIRFVSSTGAAVVQDYITDDLALDTNDWIGPVGTYTQTERPSFVLAAHPTGSENVVSVFDWAPFWPWDQPVEVPSAAFSVDAVISAPTADATADANTPTIRGDAIATAPMATATADANTPTVVTGAEGLIPLATGEDANQLYVQFDWFPFFYFDNISTLDTAPAFAIATTITVPAPAAATASSDAPTLANQAILSAPMATATGDANTPTVTAGVEGLIPLAQGEDANQVHVQFDWTPFWPWDTTTETPPSRQDATITGVTADATADANAPTLKVDAVVTAPMATATADANAPTLKLDAVITGVMATATADANTPTLANQAIITGVMATATADANTPTLVTGIDVFFPLFSGEDANQVHAQFQWDPHWPWDAPSATDTAYASRVLDATQATATADANAPTVITGATITGVTATATADANAPSTTGSVTIDAPQALATAAANAPTISAGATVTGVMATATADANAPSLVTGVEGLIPLANGEDPNQLPQQHDWQPFYYFDNISTLDVSPQFALAITVAAPSADASASANAPTLKLDAVITGVMAAATADAMAPALSLGVTITSPAADATADATAPSSAGSVTIDSPMATATADALAPTTILYKLVPPVSDVSTGTWHDTPLYEKVDESPYDDGDYITSGNNPADDTAELALDDDFGSPMTSGWIVRYRAKVSDVTPSQELEVQLVQGTTVIASWTETTMTTSFQTFEHTLSDPEIASITDVTDLRVRLIARVV